MVCRWRWRWRWWRWWWLCDCVRFYMLSKVSAHVADPNNHSERTSHSFWRPWRLEKVSGGTRQAHFAWPCAASPKEAQRHNKHIQVTPGSLLVNLGPSQPTWAGVGQPFDARCHSCFAVAIALSQNMGNSRTLLVPAVCVVLGQPCGTRCQ